jgi:hypothetical protein
MPYTTRCSNYLPCDGCTGGQYYDYSQFGNETPLPNSHFVCECFLGIRCSSIGNVYFACDTGYSWNGSACVAPPSGGGGSMPMILLNVWLLKGIVRKQLKKRFVAMQKG